VLLVLLVGTTDGAPLAVAGGRLGEGTAVVAVGTGGVLGSAALAAGVPVLPDALGTPELEDGPPGEVPSVRRPVVSTKASTTAATTRATAAASNPIRRREREPAPGEAVDIRTLCAERRTALVGAIRVRITARSAHPLGRHQLVDPESPRVIQITSGLITLELRNGVTVTIR
jgi:hypothetical protein